MAKCADCNSVVFRLAPGTDLCQTCYAKVLTAKAEARLAERSSMEQTVAAEDPVNQILLTTESAFGGEITERLGIVTAEYVVGIHIFRDIATNFRDFFGGRSATMQRGLKEARTAALYELRMEALELGGDAVVAVDLDYSEISGGGKNMLLLVASGTAVKMRAESKELT